MSLSVIAFRCVHALAFRYIYILVMIFANSVFYFIAHFKILIFADFVNWNAPPKILSMRKLFGANLIYQ